MLTPKDNIQSILKITSISFNERKTRSNSKSTLPKLTGHLAQTEKVVPEPLVGVSMTIPLNNGVTTKSKRSTQLSEMKECVAPV